MVTLGQVLSQWEQAGIFDLALPFFLIFAVIFGILQATNILGKNKGVHTIVSVTIALMALRSSYISYFFSELFPRLGVGLAVLVALLILVGMFIADDERRYWYWGLGTIGVIIFLIAITKSFENVGYTGFYGNIEDYAGWIVLTILTIGLIIAVAAAGGKEKESKGGGIKLTAHRGE